uniref:Activin_recp domain-containing protein n=1 Tax=Panagrellus redivivus TaxID=6233 RepID=A0A7E4ZPX4_PANRE
MASKTVFYVAFFLVLFTVIHALSNLLCYSTQFHMTPCEKENQGCMYQENLKTGQVWKGCVMIPPEKLQNVEKCYKNEQKFIFACLEDLCNVGSHVCEKGNFKLEDPYPFEQSPPTTTKATTTPTTTTPATTSSPKKKKRRRRRKNTGNRSIVPTIAMLVLVVGFYFTI